MEDYPELVTLAKKYNVQSKFDPFETDKTYFVKWYETLTRFDELVSKCPIKMNIKDVKTCNPHTFYNIPNEIYKVKNSLCNDTDLTEFEAFVDKVIENEKNTKEYISKQKQNHPQAGQKIKKTVFVIDVDWENFENGSNIILYCRDVESMETYCLLYPYFDYFYVKLSDEKDYVLDHKGYQVDKKNGSIIPSIDNIRKLAIAYDWYLKNQNDKNNEKKKNTENEWKTPEERMNRKPFGQGGFSYFNKFDVIDGHKSIYGYQPHTDKFCKVYSRYVTATDAIFKSISGRTSWEVFEANVNYITKFLVEHNISACIPITFEGVVQKRNHVSNCDNLIQCTSLQRCEGGPAYTPIMYYYDIECLSHNPEVFPDAETCPIIQISYQVFNGSTELKRGVLCLHDTPGDKIYESFETEEQLLIRFAQTVLEWSPDALAGFNSNIFDMPYIIDRMRVLKIDHIACKFSRRKGFPITYKRSFKESNQQGAKESVIYKTPGFVMFDILDIIRSNVTIRLRSYSLKNICAVYLKDDNKEELCYEDIPELFKTAEGRTTIASYCMKDTLLLRELDNVLQLGNNAWSMSSVLGTTPNFVLNRGLVFKLMCKLKSYTTRFKLLIPSFTKENKPKFEGKYKGAFVLDPEIGYHEDPIVTLDFKSLYPSLMIAYNLSYETLVRDTKWVDQNPENFEEHCGEWFVKQSVYKGVIPCLEEELAIERSKAKKMRDKFPEGSDEYNVYECLQLANKIIMNSLYGMLGSPTASVPMREVAKTITGLGRDNLLMAKDYVEKHYVDIVKKEFPEDPERKPCRVIYGDTDSIFIKMPGVSIADAIKYGKMLDVYTQKYVFQNRPPMELEYEKTFYPFYIQGRKQYSGALYTDNPNKFKVKSMGIKLVRRDTAELCTDVMQGFVDKVFKDKDINGAKEFLKTFIGDLFQERFPLRKFTIVKKIAKRNYVVEPPHVTAWKRMVNRVGVARAPRVGSMFEHVVTKISKHGGLKEAIIDYELASSLEHCELDKDYYFLTYIYNTLYKFCIHIIGEQGTKEIFNTKLYARVDTVVSNKKNILSFFGVNKIEKRRKLL